MRRNAPSRNPTAGGGVCAIGPVRRDQDGMLVTTPSSAAAWPAVASPAVASPGAVASPAVASDPPPASTDVLPGAPGTRRIACGAGSTAPSTVEGLTVPQVRASLSVLRARWAKHSPVSPLYPSLTLPCGRSASAFAHAFIMGHHAKRQRR